MARIPGFKIDSFLVDDSAGTQRNIKDSVLSFDPGSSINLYDTTTIDSDQMEREAGLKDQELTISAMVTDDTDIGTVPVFLLNQTGKRTVKIKLKDSALYYNGEMLIENANLTRGTDANLEMSVTMKGASEVTNIWTAS